MILVYHFVCITLRVGDGHAGPDITHKLKVA